MTLPDDDYFRWLTSQIDYPTSHSYFDLFSRMHLWDFAWFISGDDNRRQDALDLRREFYQSDYNSRNLVSVLEVVIVLSRAFEFTADGPAPYWAWHMIKNLGLVRCSDPLKHPEKVDDILHALVWRTYEPNGRGGFFPLKYPKEDQRKVELWYQMNAYIQEMQI